MSNIQSTNTSVIEEIPEFKTLKQCLECDQCDKDCKYNPNRRSYPETLTKKMDCKKMEMKVYTIESIVLSVFLVMSILISYLIFKTFWTLCITVVVVGSLGFTADMLFEKIVEEKSFQNEKDRKEAYKQKVKQIKENNERIRRLKNGETEEFCEFIEEFHRITKKLEDEKELLTGGSRVTNLLEELIKHINSLSIDISPSVYKMNSIQNFCNQHLLRLLESVTHYKIFEKSNSVTQNQIKEFEQLLNTFITKVQKLQQDIKSKKENDLISMMKSLEKEMNSEAGE